MNKVGWPDFFLRPNAIGSGGATGDHGGEGRGRSFPPSSVWAGMGASVARGSRVTSHKEPRARFFPVTVMGWRRRPSCLSVPLQTYAISPLFSVPISSADLSRPWHGMEGFTMTTIDRCEMWVRFYGPCLSRCIHKHLGEE